MKILTVKDAEKMADLLIKENWKIQKNLKAMKKLVTIQSQKSKS